MPGRFRLVFGFAVVVAIVCQDASILAQTKITIGVAAMSPRTIPLLIAQEQGLFAKQGIDARIVLIKGAPILVASLISGDLEVGYTGGTSVLGAAAQGPYLKILSSISSKLTHTMLPRTLRASAICRGRSRGFRGRRHNARMSRHEYRQDLGTAEPSLRWVARETRPS